MKTTLDLPEELRVSHEGVRSLENSRQTAEAWLGEWQALGVQIRAKAIDPRPLVEILAEDREGRPA